LVARAEGAASRARQSALHQALKEGRLPGCFAVLISMI